MEQYRKIPENQLLELIDKARDFALINGLCMRSKKHFNPNILQFAPFILFPSSFPRDEYNKACEMQLILNSLMHAVANDYDFLKESLQDTIETDDFTKRLFEIYETVREEGFAQDISLTLLRSDLMLNSAFKVESDCNKHKPYCCWKQVEINTIASGHGWMGPTCTKLHHYILKELDLEDELKNLPENNALSGLCSGIIEAWKLYGNPSAAILFIVEDVSYNICDQRAHEYEISRQKPNIKVLRKTLTELIILAHLNDNKELIVSNYCIAVVYFRSGYSPVQYYSDKEWDVRLLIERSKAIKCPSIQYHLSGTKKVQQALAKPGILKKFLKDSNSINRVEEIFTGLYSLDFDEQGEAAIDMALQNPNHFVLKPQREGGCNNLFGNDIIDFFKKNRNKKQRVAWILMDKICPPIQMNYMIQPDNSTNTDPKKLVSELGIFGVLLSSPKTVYLNKEVGHTLRTKLDFANEGGVATGLGACDSPYLID